MAASIMIGEIGAAALSPVRREGLAADALGASGSCRCVRAPSIG
jgi:hypothetical protein